MSNPQLDPEETSENTSGGASKTRHSANGGSAHSGSIEADSQPVATERSDGGLSGFAWALACMFAIALMVSGWSLIQESQRAQDLGSEMQLLIADLEASNLELAAQKEAMGPIRDQVEQIVASVGQLQSLVAAESDEVAALSAAEETLPEAAAAVLVAPLSDSEALEGVVEPAEVGAPGTAEETLTEEAAATPAAPLSDTEALEGVLEPADIGALGTIEEYLFEAVEATPADAVPESVVLEGLIEPDSELLLNDTSGVPES